MSSYSPSDAGLRFAFTEEQRELAQGVRQALAELCPPEVVRQGWQGPVEGLEQGLAELGLYGMTLAEEEGGLGLGALDAVLVHEELGRACVPGPVAEGMVLAPLLAEAGERELAEALVNGELRVGVFRAGEPCAHARDAGLLLSWTPAEVCVVEEPVIHGVSSVDGSRRAGVVQGDTRPLAVEPDLLRDQLLVAHSAQLLGLSRHMLHVTVAYAKVREQFGTPIGSQQAVQHHLADALLALRFAAPVVHQAAWSLHHRATWTGLHAAMAKVKAAEAAEQIARIALQVHGAIAYTTEYDLHLWMRRAWALSRTWGGVREHLDTIAVALLEEGPGAPQAPVDGIDLGVPRG